MRLVWINSAPELNWVKRWLMSIGCLRVTLRPTAVLDPPLKA